MKQNATTDQSAVRKPNARFRIRTAFGGLLSGVLMAACAPAIEAPTALLVERITDGDTIVVAGEPVRVIGMNAPESWACLDREGSSRSGKCLKWGATGDPCAARATLRAHELLDGQQVTLEPDATTPDRDSRDRLLRHVRMADGRLFAMVMIREGLAHAAIYFGQIHQHAGAYEAAETLARQDGTGCVGVTDKSIEITDKPNARLHSRSCSFLAA